MSGKQINVRYKKDKRPLDFNLDGTFEDMLDTIRTSFNIERNEKIHILAKDEKDSMDIDIDSDFKVRRLSRIRFSIDVYPGGPFLIWLGKEEWSLLQAHAEGSYLVQKLKREHLIPDDRFDKFTQTLNTLLESLKLASACLTLSNNKVLSNKLYHLCVDELRPVSAKCSSTFEKIAENNLLLVKSLKRIFEQLRDNEPKAAECHIEQIKELARKMRKESGDRVKDLKNAEGSFDEILKSVEDIPIKDDCDIVKKLHEDAVTSLRELGVVMFNLQQFWAFIEKLANKTDRCVFMNELEDVCKPGKIYLSRSEDFKISAAIYMASHIAIREGCLELNDKMKEFTESLNKFLVKPINKTVAQQIRDINLKDGVPREETRRVKREKRNGADPETVARVDDVLSNEYYFPKQKVSMPQEQGAATEQADDDNDAL